MSKIHQAIRRAEKEGSSDIGRRSVIPRNILDEIKRNIVKPEKAEPEPAIQGIHDSPPRTIPVPLSGEFVEIRVPSDSKLVALSSPKSIASEQYRALRTKIFQMQQEKGLKTLLITSAGMADGKTLTAINLALTMSHEINRRVLMVDGDLRRPTLHKHLGVSTGIGLSDYLSEKCSLDQVIFGTEIPNFYFVPAGTLPDNPAELINSQRMQYFLTHTSDSFDWVIIDSPPIIALADADLLASKADGVIFVVRALHTPSDLLVKSMESLKGKNLLGVVLNCYEDEKTSKYSYYYHYGSRDSL